MQDNVTRALGLVTQYNPLAVSPGALVQADNCVIRRENIIENRRGYALYGSPSGSPAQLFTYSGKILGHYSTSVIYDNGSGTFAAYSGSYSAPSGYLMRAIEANSNCYVTTSAGVQVFTDTAGTAARKAGAPRSLDPSYALNTAATGFLGTLYQCAYRVTIVRKDANGNTLTGYPSTRLWVYNSAGTSKNVDLTLYLPSEVTTSDIIQFHRTAQVNGSTSDIAGDEMALVYQTNPSSTDITNGYLTFTDSIVDALRGASLYTSPSQQGIQGANERPPLCKDIALYKSAYMFYANTSTKQRLQFTMVGTAGLTGNTITLAGTTYNFGAAEIVSGAGSPQAAVSATGVPAFDIDATARSLVRVINRYASNTSVYAYYLSGPSDLPGQIMIEERGVGGSAFTLQCSSTTIQVDFFPYPPVGPATNTNSTSSNQVQTNAVYYSKSQELEHVPLLNYLPVGPSNTNILRIAALRDSLIIIKEEGVYRLTGDSSTSFVVVPLDLTVRCKSANSVAVVANQVFMLSNQGVVAISDTGVQVVSREIEPTILPLLTYSGIGSYTYGAGYESEREYLISTMSTSSDTSATQTFAFNFFTRTWTRKFDFGMAAMVVEPAGDKIYFSKPSTNAVYVERKTFSDSDYYDPESAITITSISGKTVAFTLSSGTPLSGWIITQGGSDAIIDTVTGATPTWTATLLNTAPTAWTTGAATILPSIAMAVQWDAWTAGHPGELKHVRQVEILADNISSNSTQTAVDETFVTDIDNATDTVNVISLASRWGKAPWGTSSWGGASEPYRFPTWVPRNKQYLRVLNLGVKHYRAKERFSCTGFSVTYEMVSERVGK